METEPVTKCFRRSSYYRAAKGKNGSFLPGMGAAALRRSGLTRMRSEEALRGSGKTPQPHARWPGRAGYSGQPDQAAKKMIGNGQGSDRKKRPVYGFRRPSIPSSRPAPVTAEAMILASATKRPCLVSQ